MDWTVGGWGIFNFYATWLCHNRDFSPVLHVLSELSVMCGVILCRFYECANFFGIELQNGSTAIVYYADVRLLVSGATGIFGRFRSLFRFAGVEQ